MLAIVIALGVASTASAQDPFPDGPGKDVTVRICGTCHPSARGAAVRLTREGWQDVIAKMVSLGAKGTDDELAAVLDYLSTHFKGDAPKPVNLNTAPAIDLESVAGLLRKEAAALIAYRAEAPVQGARGPEEGPGRRLPQDRPPARPVGLFLILKVHCQRPIGGEFWRRVDAVSTLLPQVRASSLHTFGG